MCIRGVLKMGHLRVCGVAMGIYGLISWETMGGQGAGVWFGQDLVVDSAEIWPVFGNQCAIRQRNMYLHWNKGGISPVDNSWVEKIWDIVGISTLLLISLYLAEESLLTTICAMNLMIFSYY